MASKSNKTTSFDIAYLAGVSQPTVSRALRNSPLVSKTTREKVQAIAKELNYKVDINARNLRSKYSKTLALLLCEDPGTGNSLINPFFLSMLGSITQASAKKGYDLLISFQQYSDDWSADYEDTHRADGIIFLGYGDYVNYLEKIKKLDRLNAHYVTWGPVVAEQSGHFLGCDNLSGAHTIVQHLANLGRKKVAFLGDISEQSPEFRSRYDGYVKALIEAKLIIDPNLQISAKTSEESGYEAAKALIASGLEFDSVFGASDLISIGAIKALKEADYDIPNDISVVGFDDVPIAAYCQPALTTIQQDTIHAGELLVNNLVDLIEGKPVTSHLLPAKLVVRHSCGQRGAQ